MNMRKILAFILALVMVLSLAACGGGNDAPSTEPNDVPDENTEPSDVQTPEDEPEPEPEEVTHDVDRIDMETESGKLVYTDYEFAGESFYSDYVAGDPSKTIILNFDFTNKESKPSGVQSAFSITVYQNGAEINGPSSWAHSTEAMDNFFNTGMKDSTIPIGRAYILNDTSPLTVMVEERGNTDNYQMMEVEITANASAPADDAAPADDSGNAGSDAPSTKGLWSLNYYVDNFNQPTDQWYISTDDYFSGTFSNSATTDSKLLTIAAVDFEGNISFFLWEYGRNQVKNSSERTVDEYNITMRTPDGTDHELTGTIYCGGDRLFIDDAYVNDVLTAMQGEGTISFYIVQADRTTTTYLFSIEADNFGSVYAEVAG